MCNLTHLVAKDSNSACGRDLILRKPDSGKARRHTEGEHLRHADDELCDERQDELVRVSREDLKPRADTHEQRP